MNDLKTLQEKLQYDKTFDCVQCGYCLPACPTYETMEKETHSPRGRINLVKMAAEGKTSLEDLEEPIEKCLGCMACTTVCPTNVQYGAILEGAKETLEDNKEKSKRSEKTEEFLFRSFFPSSKWMNRLGNATWLYQATGLQKVARSLCLTAMAPLHLGEFEKVIPSQPSPSKRKKRLQRVEPEGTPAAKIAFFTGCVMDSVFFEINQQTIELMKLSGAEVILPEHQTCCGALHAHSGKVGLSKELAMENIKAFEDENIDYIVNNAGGCGARLIEYDHLFEEGTKWHRRAKAFTEKVKDISEVLVELDALEFSAPVEKLVTYQPSCHMTNVQRVTKPPRQLIEQVPGVKLREMNNPDFCCGSAGVYNIVNYEDSMEILNKKMEDVNKTNPEVIVTTNPGCLLQMKLGVEREGKSGEVQAFHLVELLMEASPRPKK
ncbi:(Fe-S)-binding protein [Alteribacillus bidgolensis]|uniref:Glycolate oxidase iron-sulfur subunit n=1 Tax=Alteribacillus bidgolensis TaxID=930129 RepID=A0A1G8I6X4_9BACI|nr:(Fe-S)-binding protein [Alteribacillus bidgolensis]SDI14330.1 glycolate oxidase iron-sulfur subunit [Alteribacillus bidgolensis]